MQQQDFYLCISIPAYNEEGKLNIEAYRRFLVRNSGVALIFINDASTDGTLQIIEDLKIQFGRQVTILTNKQNIGKAESVRTGINYILNNYSAEKIAFLDADLATSLEECVLVSATVKNGTVFSFGSRILTVDSNIQRKAYRHYIGRFVATAISKTLKLEVYDTQCGCKVFSNELARSIFKEAFISRWLFDVELFFRTIKKLGRENIARHIHEHPLKQWIDKGESKVKFSYFFKLWIDLFTIKRKYKGV